MDLYWYAEPLPSERVVVETWLEANDCGDVAVLSIGPTTVVAFGTNGASSGWGTSEMRKCHDDLPSALDAVVARLRSAP
jgi:hypothetical protein